jgi:hypothetical protein
MITLDLSILNQKGTPMFYSDTLALRPAFGIVGRIFIATDSPYGIFRDTGSAWDQIAGSGGGGIGGSGTLNTIAMFTPSGTAIGDSAITQTASNVTVTARNLIVTNGAFTLSHTHNPVNGTFNPYGEQIAVTNTFNAGITWTALLACFNSSSLQNNLFNGSVTFGNGSYTTNNLNLSSITFNAAGSTITSTQASGGIRAYANQILQLRIDGTNNGTYTHYANSAVYGDFASSTARFTITNRYGYLVNNLDEYSAGHTYTNRWAFYNAGINDNNFFAGKVGIGSGYVPSTFQLDLKGDSILRGNVLIRTVDSLAGSLALDVLNSGFSTLLKVNNNGSAVTMNLGLTAIGTKTITGIAGAYIGNTGGIQWGASNGNSVNIFAARASGPERNILAANADSGVKIQLPNDGVFVASAILNVESTTQGFLPPKMTTTQKNAIASPVAALVVFDTTLVKLCVYNGASWETITSI